MGDEAVEFLLSNKGFQIKQEIESFLVWDARERIIRIFSLENWNQFCEFVIMAISLNGIFKGLPAYNGREMAILFTMPIKLSSVNERLN